MTLTALTLGYLGVGLALALLSLRRGRGAADAALVVLAWPLYAPALGGPVPEAPPVDEPARAALAVRAALTSVREAAEGSPFATLLGASAEARLSAEIERAAARMRAIDLELSHAALGAAAGGPSAGLRAESDASLRALRAADAATMAELCDLLGALRSRIVLARHAGSSAEGPNAIVAEVWARIEGLGEAVACTQPRASTATPRPERAPAATAPLPPPPG